MNGIGKKISTGIKRRTAALMEEGLDCETAIRMAVGIVEKEMALLEEHRKDVERAHLRLREKVAGVEVAA